MRAVIQRVTSAQLTVNGVHRGDISRGFVVLLGVCNEDTEEDALWLVRKIAGLRVFSDEQGVMNLDIKSLTAGPEKGQQSDIPEVVTGDIMVVSQFTLFASYKKGNRPAWLKAARHEIAVPLYEKFCKEMEQALGKPIVTGDFGADMQIQLCNDGPVTICMDTKNKE